MAFFLTPRFAPAYQPQACNPFSYYSAPRPTYRRVVSRPAFPSFVPFLSQVDELLTELDREARRAQHIQRQQRKRAFRARFEVQENNEGYEVQGDIHGFEQQNIQIEVTDENTLRVAGNTEWKSEQASTSPEPERHDEATKDIEMDGATLAEPEATTTEFADVTDAEIIHSDTSSQKSYQATVEDDFEDLGAETSSTISSTTEAETKQPKEPKGKEKAVETSLQQQPQPEIPATTTETEQEQPHASFERTFRFPERIDAATVKASFNNGILSIQVPRAPKHQIRQIAIQ
ncbi:hypothetical protein B0J11DRAFT_528917 [Dendryphion nanum]|uniref:SHSP domain-containing protein n=1 Tax=Dendryphion nanum TaxID=256645 RepID=A0A9P9DUR8_9PLEO|nr:hypothetical protein B0J11DRAFT_528917 [Dendryphion nanum]